MPSRSPADCLPLTHDTYLILIVLTDVGRHGYGIMQEVAVRSEGMVALQTGALYRTLKRMLDDAVIEECNPPAGEAVTDERRRYYRRTAFGDDVLHAETERLSRLVRAARMSSRGQRPRLA